MKSAPRGPGNFAQRTMVKGNRALVNPDQEKSEFEEQKTQHKY